MRGDAGSPYDAAVIGAGPAGATAATLLARAGWAVAVVERQAFPRRKVCGECIAASNLPLLQTLGIGEAFAAQAGAELRQVRLLRGGHAVSADLPDFQTAPPTTAADPRHRWGRALGRETLDTLLLAQARAAGVEVWQPWAVQAIGGSPGAWHCDLRAADSAAATRRLHAALVIDAHGSWEDLPTQRRQARRAQGGADLFAFKANFTGSALRPGVISVLALDGGYGGMVLEAGGLVTVACCIRRDRLGRVRAAAPGLRVGDAVQAWLQSECSGVQQALHGARRVGPWLACGPLDPGVRLAAHDTVFKVGNAAGEAHPILGEGISMALQSAALLCSHLLGAGLNSRPPDAPAQAALQRHYAADWRREFAPRLRLAAAFAHAAMRPPAAALLLAAARAWPGLLTHGARWGGKVRPPAAGWELRGS